MKRKSFKRLGAALMAAILMMSSFGNMSVVRAEEIQSLSESNVQMSSDKEVVYVNIYDASKREHNFDENWKFYLGDASGAESATFDDSRWETVNLPHDYSIEQEFTASGEAESAYLLGGTGWYRKYFTLDESMRDKELRIDFGGVYMNATVWVNGNRLGTHPYGYTPFSFDITDYVKFDGENVITVKVDHQTPSSRWYSGSGIYRSVNLTVMDKVHVDLYGTKITTPELETEMAADNGVTMNIVTTVANESEAPKDVVLTHTVYKKGTDASIGNTTTTAQNVAAGEAADITAEFNVNKPELWGLGEENVNLYTVKTEVKVDNKVVDTYETDYGFRYFSFDTNTGFSLNGEKVKLKGVCMHHDQGSLGAEAYYRAIERQVEILQEMGCNSIRVTHNPAADELIEICNEKGVLVIDEAFDGWMYNKNGNSNDYSVWFETAIEADNQIIGADAEPMAASANDDILGSVNGLSWAQFDLTSMIKRGQNAPSIIMWSLGNEVWEGAGGQENFPKVAATLSTWAKTLDDSRPSTIGDNYLKHQNGNSYAMGEALEAVGGIVGGNYCVQDGANHDYDIIHRDHPEWPLYGSETASAINSRGVYDTTANSSLNADKELTSYDYSSVGWGNVASSAWYDVITRDFVAGEYVWTGFDYLGEPTPANGTGSGAQGSWPSPKNSFFGIIDTAGLPKDTYYFYQSQWNDEVNTLHVLPAWNENVVVSGEVPIVVYSDAAKVELFFTGADGVRRSLGEKAFTKYTTEDAGYTYQMYEGEGASSTTHQNMYLTWYKEFEEGTIEAVAYDENNVVISNTVGRSTVTTTGAATQLSASVDRNEITADGKDLAYITVDVKDADGNIVPDAANNVRFVVEGDGVLVGVDNGKQADHQSYQDDNRNAYNGSLVAIVQSTKEDGTIKVTAQSDGLLADIVTITTTAADSGTTEETRVDSFYMSKNYYVKSGNTVTLPTTIETRYTGGTSENLSVVWDTITETTGTFGVNGVVDGKYSVSVVVNMIDEVAGLLNYSTATPVGQVITLPEARPAVLADGEILNVSFPVTWETVAESAFATAGTITVNGTANVLGETINVTASIRVQEEQITVSGSVDAPLHVVQDIPAESQSDTLEAIYDGSTAVGDNNDGGANETAWTNWQYSQDGNTTAEITFDYATQQRVGEIVIHFFTDNDSARLPAAGTTEIWVSESGEEGSWTKVAVTKETPADPVDRVSAYTYEFAAFAATYIKFCFTNAAKTEGMTWEPCTGITEIEIKKAVGSFSTNTTAELASMTVNGVALTEDELASGVYYTLEESAVVEAVGADNAAVTVLPAYNEEIRAIIESEDHNTRKTFVIHLNEATPIDPNDSGKDIPVSVLTAEAGDQQSVDEGATKVLDGNTNTIWHTNWYGTSRENHYIDFTLSEEYMVDGLRYQPRQAGGSNGNITEYEIKVSNDGNSWTPVASGTWTSDSAWKSAAFRAQNVKYVRLVAVNATTDSNYVFASAAEIRLTGTKVETPTTDAELVGISVNQAPTTTYTVGQSFDPAGLVLNLAYSDGTTDTVAYADAASDFRFNLTDALTADNTSVTISYEGKSTVLGIAVTADTSLPADDASRDYTGTITTSAGTAYENTLANATDGSTSTHWETDWNQGATTYPDDFWFMLELAEATELEALRYYPRHQGTNLSDGNQNGFISKYTVEVSSNGTEWTKVAEGRWAPEGTTSSNTYAAGAEWLIAEFNTPVTAKYVRLKGEETLTHGYARNVDMSIAEIHVRKTDDTASQEKVLSGISVNAAPKTVYKAGETFDPTGLVLNLAYSDGTRNTVAYADAASDFAFNVNGALTTNNNSVTITYGEKTTELGIVVVEEAEVDPNPPEVTLTSIAVKTAPTKVVYTEGDTLDVAGLVITLTYSDGSTEDVNYSDEADKFTFDPALTESLQTSDTSVTVAYEAKTTTFTITVNETQGGVDPDVPEVVVPGTPIEAPSDAYEIYPIPQAMQYYAGTWVLRTQANVIYEDGIDEATKARLEEAVSLKGMNVSEASAIAAGKTNILVGIYESGGYVDQFVSKNYDLTTDNLFNKTDAYFLASLEDTIIVLGKDTDAAFYGLTSLYHIFGQMESKEIHSFMMEDWADVVSRGFIEGYYGNPWSVEDRSELMEWGGYYKLNSYFYAPKDDPKHNSQWKVLYTEEELNTLIKPLAEAGNASKCRFVFALHPYMHNAIRYDSEEHYQEDLAIMQAKFEQVIEAGVRQIAILADDAGNVGGANYIRTLEDMTEWIKEMQKTYPDLKLTLPFCTQEYMYNGESYYANFPENVQIVMTGGRVWGEVSESFTTTFTNNAGRGPYMWVNWPCSDNSKNHLIMGGYTTFLHPGVDASKIQGIVLNPMQQSEPSKVAIFGNAAYSWNIWTQEEADQAWIDSFKYVDHNSAAETKASQALRELSRHMINQNMDSRVTPLQESENIKDTLNTFKTKLTAGTTVTEAECDEIIAIFEELQKAAETYSASGNERIKGQIIYWLDCWADTTDAAIAYLEAIKAEIDSDSNTLINKYNEGASAFAQSKTHGFHYLDHTEYAEVGVQHIVPFINALETYVSGRAELILNPDAVLTTFITSRTDTPAVGSIDNILDGNEDTKAIFQNPNDINKDDYVGLMFSKVIDITDVKFVLGAGKDHFDQAKVQYTMDGETWEDLEGTYAGVQGQVQKVELTETDLPENFQAMGIRLVATVDNAADAWLEVRDIAVNSVEEEAGSSIDYSNIIKSDEWTIASAENNVVANLYDGNDSTRIWYDTGADDIYAVDDYLGYNFGKVLTLKSAHIVVGNGTSGDKLVRYAVETSVNGNDWTPINGYADYTGAQSGPDTLDIALNGVEAQYIRVRSLSEKLSWVMFSEFTVEIQDAESTENVYTNLANAGIYSEVSEGSISLTGGEITMQSGDYIGIDLKNIKAIKDITATVENSALKLQSSMNTVIWTDVSGNTYEDARYIRLVNTSDTAQTVTFGGMTVEFEKIQEKSVTSTLGTGDTSRDMRSKGNVADVFDGDLTTYGEITSAQTAGQAIVFDLGQTISFKTLRYYIYEANADFLRHAKFEVSVDGDEWTEVLVVGNADAVNMGVNTTAKDADYLTHDSSNPGYMYAEAKGLKVEGRYIRVVPQTTYSSRWMQFNEIQINGGEYLSTEDNRDIVSDTIEVPYQIPSNALDKDYSTNYVNSAGKGSFTYRLSEPQGVQAIRIIQIGEPSNATVKAEFKDPVETTGLLNMLRAFFGGTDVEIGTLNQSINEFNVPDGNMLLSVTVEWDGKKSTAPTITEIVTLGTKTEAEESIAAIDALLETTDEDISDTWTEETKEAYETAKANALEAVENEYISETSASSILAALRSAIGNGVERYTSDELAEEVENAVSNEDGTYTPSTYRAYADALAEAESALQLQEAGNLSKTDGERICNELKTAKAALVYSEENKETAQLLVKDISKYKEDNYSANTWQAMQDAKEALEEIIVRDTDESRVHPSDYTEAITAAEAAIENLTDVTALKAALDEYKQADKDAYTSSSWRKYEKAAEAAEKLLVSGTKETVAKALADLEEAALALDAVSLDALIAQAKKYTADDYTAKSFETLQGAIQTAEAATTGEAKEAAEEALRAAINGLVNISALKAKVAEVKAIDLSEYPDAKAEALNKAIADAEALYAAGTKKQVANALTKLINAQNALTSIDKPSQGGSSSGSSSTSGGSGSSTAQGGSTAQGSQTGQGASTGDSANIVPFIVILIVAAAAFGFVQYKKKREEKES